MSLETEVSTPPESLECLDFRGLCPRSTPVGWLLTLHKAKSMQGIITLNRMFGRLRETVSRFMNQNPVRNKNVEFGWRRVLRPNSLPEPLPIRDRIQWQLHRQLPEEHPEVVAVQEDHLSILMEVQVDGEDFPGIMDDPMDHQEEEVRLDSLVEDQVVEDHQEVHREDHQEVRQEVHQEVHREVHQEDLEVQEDRTDRINRMDNLGRMGLEVVAEDHHPQVHHPAVEVPGLSRIMAQNQTIGLPVQWRLLRPLLPGKLT